MNEKLQELYPTLDIAQLEKHQIDSIGFVINTPAVDVSNILNNDSILLKLYLNWKRILVILLTGLICLIVASYVAINELDSTMFGFPNSNQSTEHIDYFSTSNIEEIQNAQALSIIELLTNNKFIDNVEFVYKTGLNSHKYTHSLHISYEDAFIEWNYVSTLLHEQYPDVFINYDRHSYQSFNNTLENRFPLNQLYITNLVLNWS